MMFDKVLSSVRRLIHSLETILNDSSEKTVVYNTLDISEYVSRHVSYPYKMQDEDVSEHTHMRTRVHARMRTNTHKHTSLKTHTLFSCLKSLLLFIYLLFLLHFASCAFRHSTAMRIYLILN